MTDRELAGCALVELQALIEWNRSFLAPPITPGHEAGVLQYFRRTPSSEGDGRDGERLDWLCAVDPARRVEGGMGFRAYEDAAPLDVEHSHWVALTDRFYGTAREAIDAAIAAAEGSE